MDESRFHSLTYPEQTRLIAYTVLREREESLEPGAWSQNH